MTITPQSPGTQQSAPRAIYRSQETPHGGYGFKSYCIEADLTDPRRPMQRHIWTHDDGRVEAEDWIDSIRSSPDQLIARGWKRIET